MSDAYTSIRLELENAKLVANDMSRRMHLAMDERDALQERVRDLEAEIALDKGIIYRMGQDAKLDERANSAEAGALRTLLEDSQSRVKGLEDENQDLKDALEGYRDLELAHIEKLRTANECIQVLQNQITELEQWEIKTRHELELLVENKQLKAKIKGLEEVVLAAKAYRECDTKDIDDKLNALADALDNLEKLPRNQHD